MTNIGDKSQGVRLLDVFVFGPLMIAGARDQKSPYFSTALTLIGLGTIVYNGVNYLQKRNAGDQDTGLDCVPSRLSRCLGGGVAPGERGGALYQRVLP